ncbi:MFS transporter [Brachybacterium hainanense]|uniref:MFS transporter n=1 Tax=Brachybacterium hainanense TaxID=1541174 RepID=A0ABV6RCI2_9MICO
MKSFHHILVNTLLANVTTSFLWFALTFWIYLETRSVLATGIIGGSYMALVALCSLGFGVVVDHMRKKNVMLLSSVVTFGAYLLAGGIWLALPHDSLLRVDSPAFWLFILVILAGSVVENMRNIALSTTVTLLVPEGERDKANGLVGAVQGIAFMVTSVFSGLAIGLLGMGPTLLIAILATGAALAHLTTVRIPEARVAAATEQVPGSDGDPVPARSSLLGTLRGRVDLAGSIAVIRGVPGLAALILFTCFNNLVGGVYMALMDPYGLELLSPEAWGIVLGVTSTGFIIGGAIISRTGLGRNPVRTLLLVNVGVAVVGGTFAIRESWILFAVGILVFMTMIPAAEAAEQTILQRVVPFSRQGRVFGFAQSVETAATPVSAFLVAPLAEFWVIPWMREGSGQETLGWLVGTGDARGIALMFMGGSVVMLAVIALAFASPQYRRLSAHYAHSSQDIAGGAETAGEGADASLVERSARSSGPLPPPDAA